MKNEAMTFAANLRRLRIAAHMSQEQLAHACGFPGQSRIGNYENPGKNAHARSPKVEELPVIAKALGVTVGELFGEPPTESQVMGLSVSKLAETAKAMRLHYERMHQVFTLESERDAERFLQAYMIRERLPDDPSSADLIEFGVALEQIAPSRGGIEDGRKEGLPTTGGSSGHVAGGRSRGKT